jgi:hypothetical protein
MPVSDTVRDENAQVTATPAAAALDNDRFSTVVRRQRDRPHEPPMSNAISGLPDPLRFRQFGCLSAALSGARPTTLPNPQGH